MRLTNTKEKFLGVETMYTLENITLEEYRLLESILGVLLAGASIGRSNYTVTNIDSRLLDIITNGLNKSDNKEVSSALLGKIKHMKIEFGIQYLASSCDAEEVQDVIDRLKKIKR